MGIQLKKNLRNVKETININLFKIRIETLPSLHVQQNPEYLKVFNSKED